MKFRISISAYPDGKFSYEESMLETTEQVDLEAAKEYSKIMWKKMKMGPKMIIIMDAITGKTLFRIDNWTTPPLRNTVKPQ